MGNAAWLTREEEIALATRIETAQRAMLASLCRVPISVERIALGDMRSPQGGSVWPALSICPSPGLSRAHAMSARGAQ